MKTIMTQTASVLHRQHTIGDVVEFSYDPSEETSGRTRVVAIDAADWESMGSPDVITVTIAAGDQFNGAGVTMTLDA